MACSARAGVAGAAGRGHSGAMVTIIEVPPPTSPDDPNCWAARAETALWNAENFALFGYADLNDPEETAAVLAVPSSNRRTLRWVAMDDPDDRASVVGAASCSLTLNDNLTVATVQGVVRADRRRQGIGTLLYDAGERSAAAQGRTIIQSWASQVVGVDADDAAALHPAQGTSGHLDRTRPEAAFLLARGYTLEQVEVHSMLRVPVAAEVIDPLEAAATAASESTYRLVSWRDRCPDELVDAFAGARAAMIDAPTAGMAQEESTWSADRVREVEGRWARAGVATLVTAAQHVGTGALAGYTELIKLSSQDDSLIQEDTVVIAAHRGHRLGMRLKTANLRRFPEFWPSVRRIHTWNADENDYMRSINIALGFRAESSEGGWQKVVTAGP